MLREPLVQVDYAANEEALMLVKLLESERMLNKVLLTFGHLCAEIDDIRQEAKQMQLKFLFKDEELLLLMQDVSGLENDVDSSRNSKGGNNNNRVMLKMSESMEFLCKMQFLLQRCILLGNNLLHQCGAVVASDKVTVGIEMKMVVSY